MSGPSAPDDRTGPSPAPWPLTLLDVPALRRAGTAPVPFNQFVLKLHSRCNLACDYCYIYESADHTWRDRPVQLSARTGQRAVARIAEHVRTHRLTAIRVELHGGEPLLRGAGPLVALADQLRAALPPWCTARITVQTNGTLLTERGLARLAEAGIRVGLSLDGGTAELNRHRIDHAGRPSWPAAARAARLLQRHPESYAGVLTTIDVESPPEAVLTSLLALRPPSLALLLPHANWSARPPGAPGRYGDWLAEVFDLWWGAELPGPPIRLFREIVGLLLGRPSTTEAVGLSPVAAVIVDTDGSIEQVDALRSAYHGAAGTGLDVFRHSFDAALEHPGVAARQLGLAGLSAQCRQCSLVRVCGGGNYTHRYRRGEGFLNPSVYCADLERLIRHVAQSLEKALQEGPAGPVPHPKTPLERYF
ncbi:FxsB family cyclophane-forming radical SAM/SPASM peptide maturase [Streptacidiphilus sp. EB129]|uniref:FxsB family cyclophane-forming radical SAM/SPASM peptide maturase n=1 Tax=Streptacidiphilus sp. EB129 TaxID=3156262 RepID=UPI0035158EC7